MKLISLNVEGDKHWKRIIPFLEKEKADVICLQEVLEKDALSLSQTLGMKYAFAPMTLKQGEKCGVAIFSHSFSGEPRTEDYYAPLGDLKEFDGKRKRETIRQTLLAVRVPHEGRLYPILTTHFKWTPDGMPDEGQNEDMTALLRILDEFPEVILCGDFNIPRGVNDLYETLARKFTDAIPSSYISSLDLNLHRKGKDPVQSSRLARFVVDYLFTTKGYRAEHVRLQDGVSDHMAIVGDVIALS